MAVAVTRHAEVNRCGLFYDATVDDDAKKSGKWDQLRTAGIVVRDTVTPFIDPNEAHFFPLGTPNLFKTFFAPAD